jgi:N-acetylmuramoyl-L-alanine amidase
MQEEFMIEGAGFSPGRFPSEAASVDSTERTAIVALKPALYGVLLGRRIVLDPGGGGSEHGTLSANLVREATVNLQVAFKLRDFLKIAGAEVQLTRQGEETVSAEERISLANRFRPDLVIGIHHDILPGENEKNPVIFHYPGSEGGTKLSFLLESSLNQIYPQTEFITAESASPLLTHTSSPACEIHLGSPADDHLGDLVTGPDYRYFAAERIFSSIIGYFSNGKFETVTTGLRIVHGDTPLRGAVVSVDNMVTLPTGATGEVFFTSVEPGEHLVVIQKGEKYFYRGLLHFQPESYPVQTIDIGSCK